MIQGLHQATLTLDKKSVEHVLLKDPELREELLRAHDSLCAAIGALEDADAEVDEALEGWPCRAGFAPSPAARKTP